MAFIIVIVGLIASALGAVLLLAGRVPTAADDEVARRRAWWRTRQGIGLVGLGIVMLFAGGVWLPYRNHLTGIGTTGVLLLIVLEVLALMLNGIGTVLILLNGLVLRTPDALDEAWLQRTQRHTRIGVVVLVVGLVAQLGGVAIFAQ